MHGSEDGEAGYGEGAESQAEGDVVVGQKRSRDPALDQETQAIDVHKLKR